MDWKQLESINEGIPQLSTVYPSYTNYPKVFMNALEGYVPANIIKTLNAFLDFCYLARQNVLTEDSLNALDAALENFHRYREVFRLSGVWPDGF